MALEVLAVSPDRELGLRLGAASAAAAYWAAMAAAAYWAAAAYGAVAHVPALCPRAARPAAAC